MAFDERLASRVRALLADRGDVSERRMFGGLTCRLVAAAVAHAESLPLKPQVARRVNR